MYKILAHTQMVKNQIKQQYNFIVILSVLHIFRE